MVASKRKCFQVKQVSISVKIREGTNLMPKITIDEIEYNTEDLSDNGKAQLASLQFLEVQMNKIKSEIAVYQTARNTYLAALKADLDENSD